MRNLRVILLWFNQSPPSSSTTAPEPVDLQELKGKLEIGVMNSQRKLLCPELWIGSSFYGNCKTIADFWIQAAESLSLVFKEWPRGGFMPPQMRHEHVRDSVVHATNGTFTKHSTEAPENGGHLGTRALFFFLGCRLHDAGFCITASLFFWRHSSVLIFSHYLEFFSAYIFTYARRPYTVHV